MRMRSRDFTHDDDDNVYISYIARSNVFGKSFISTVSFFSLLFLFIFMKIYIFPTCDVTGSSGKV